MTMRGILGIKRTYTSVVVKMLQSEDEDCSFCWVGKAQQLLLDLACELVSE